MLSDDLNLIGDDQRYTALMALMLRSWAVTRVVMGAYPEGGSQGGGPALRGFRHSRVEVSSGVWLRSKSLSPTPPL